MPNVLKEEFSDTSPVLFLDPSGHSMRFYVRPGPTKMQLNPLITNGGGTLCRNQEPSAILLVDPKDVNSSLMKTGQTYISTQYIRDCVEQKQRLDMDAYKVSIGPSVQTRMASRHQENGRLSYSQEDDAAILKFMETRRNEAKGNRVWKEMEKQRVTVHSWQSMKDRFLKHLQYKLTDKSPEKGSGTASKRKPLFFIDRSLCKEDVPQTSSKTDSSQKSPRKSAVVSDSAATPVAAESNLGPTVRTNPRPSPGRASSPPDVAEAAEEPPHGSSDDGQKEPCSQIQEQESTNGGAQAPPQPIIESPEKSKRPRFDDDCEDIPDGSDKPSSSFNETRQTTSTPASKKLGILARAAREFEDSDVIDDESEEDAGPSEAQLKPSDTHESSAAPAVAAGKPECQAEDHDDAQQGASEAICNGVTQIPDDERPGPSGTAVPVTSIAHEFIFDSESQEEDYSQPTPAETLSSNLVDIKQHVVNLMRETKKDLIEVTKALLKANGDLAKAQVYLLEGYVYETHGPLWTSLDDEVLLLSDPYELKQLQSKYGEEEISRRRAFIRGDLH